jgi:hypothetical protein
MTLNVLGYEFTKTAATAWRCGSVTITREGDPTCYRAECRGLKSMFHRDPETALSELFRLAEEMISDAELVRQLQAKEVSE